MSWHLATWRWPLVHHEVLSNSNLSKHPVGYKTSSAPYQVLTEIRSGRLRSFKMNERAGDGGGEIKPLDSSAYCLGLRLFANWKRLLWLDFLG